CCGCSATLATSPAKSSASTADAGSRSDAKAPAPAAPAEALQQRKQRPPCPSEAGEDARQRRRGVFLCNARQKRPLQPSGQLPPLHGGSEANAEALLPYPGETGKGGSGERSAVGCDVSRPAERCSTGCPPPALRAASPAPRGKRSKGGNACSPDPAKPAKVAATEGSGLHAERVFHQRDLESLARLAGFR